MARGGFRIGAGRKKSVKRGGAHRTRPELSRKHAVHVTLRLTMRELRQGKAYRALRRVLGVLLGAADYRVVHISIQTNHIHLIIEAANKAALTLCMQRFTIRAARALQGAMGWTGKVFPWRYHATVIETPRQARNALAYVLNNWRKHREDITNGPRAMQAFVDPYSSGISFDGWAGKCFGVPDGYAPLPVSPPQTHLLSSEWRRCGLIDPMEVPSRPLRAH